MTTIRIRKLRKKTHTELEAAKSLPKVLVDPVEVMVCGSLRAVIAFPRNKGEAAYVEAGWEDHTAELVKAASASRSLSTATRALYMGAPISA